MENWKLSMEGMSSLLVGSLVISRKAVVDRIERILNFRESHGCAWQWAEMGRVMGKVTSATSRGATGKGYIKSGGGNREGKLHLF